MRFAQEGGSGVNVIRGYGPGELRINEDRYRTTMIVASTAARAAPTVTSAADLRAEHAGLLLEFHPEVVLIGTGLRQEFPAAAFGGRFLSAGIGFEVMDTGAACRTFNVLVSERRLAVALLMV